MLILGPLPSRVLRAMIGEKELGSVEVCFG